MQKFKQLYSVESELSRTALSLHHIIYLAADLCSIVFFRFEDTTGLERDLKCRPICLWSKVFSLMKSKIQLPSSSKESKLVSHCVCHYWPWAVAFCYFTLVLISPPDVSPLLSFLVVEFVQFDDRTVHTMTFWFPAAHWVPSPCCLHWHINFFWQPSTESTQTGSVPYF